MKILYIACGSGSDCTFGGSLIRTIEIARRVSEHNEVSILTSSGGRVSIRRILPLINIFEIKTLVSQYSFGGTYFVKQFFSYLQIFFGSFFITKRMPEFDLLYMDSDGLWDLIPALAYKRRHKSVKLVFMSHHMVTLRRDNACAAIFSLINIIHQRIGYFFINRFADAIFTLDTSVGDAIRMRFSKMGFRGELFSVQNGVDIGFLTAVTQKDKIYDACVFGALRPSKGLYDIAPIWKGVCRKNPGAKLLIIGGMLSIYKDYLSKEVANNGLMNNIIITDYIPNREDSISLLKQSKIFISPSQEEGWGIAVMECLAVELPGVVWDLPSYHKIIKGAVIKVSLRNIDDFSEGVVRLLNDRSLFDSLKSESRDSIRQYDWNMIAEKDSRFFQEVISKE